MLKTIAMHPPAGIGRRYRNLPMVVTSAEVRRLRSAGLLHLLRPNRFRRATAANAPKGRAAGVEAADPHVDDLRHRHDDLLRELRLAEQVQRSMLPRQMPKAPGVEFGASLRPAQHLAGDFYNAFRLDRDRVGFYLGDVMGHGPAAALLGVYAMQIFRPKQIDGSNYEVLSPSVVLEALSRELMAADFPGGPFITMIYGVLDVARSTWDYCCGGHPPALLLRRGQGALKLPGGSPLLGAFDIPFVPQQVQLAPGDRLVLYSDGVETVRWGEHGDGVDGLAALLEIRDGRTPQELLDEAMGMARFFQQPFDDLTLVMAQLAD